MTKTRVLVGLTAVLAALALAAAPASAEFQSLNGTSDGPSQLKASTVSEFSAEPGGIVLSCPEVQDQWKIHKNDAAQEPQLKGGHLNIGATFLKCTVKVVMMEVKIPTVACELEFVQVPGSGIEATGQVLTECLIKVPINGCEIKVPALSGTKNSELKKIALENIEKETQLLQKVNVTGITNVINEGCEKDGIKNNGVALKGGGKEGKEAIFKLEGIEHEVISAAT